MEDDIDEPQRKRPKVTPGDENILAYPSTATAADIAGDQTNANTARSSSHGARTLRLLDAPVSPPISRRNSNKALGGPPPPSPAARGISPSLGYTNKDVESAMSANDMPAEKTKRIPSPFQLNRIASLSPADNVDTVTLRDIVGDPLIKECWAFNYLFDVEFLLSNLDQDVRDTLQVYVVHGSWKREDRNRARIEEAVARHKNVKAITAYMPEAFGTHHSKMMILIRRDDTLEVVICTANMIEQDWSNMCQAVWRSPRLPLMQIDTQPSEEASIFPTGSGDRFKFDLISYVKAYRGKLSELAIKLQAYDFSQVRAALIASAPGRQTRRTLDTSQETLWGWPGLKQTLQHIPCSSPSKSRIVIQISSVASLGIRDDWLRQTFFASLSAHRSTNPVASMNASPDFSIIFPTADEIRRTTDGYGCGGSIHWKTQSSMNVRQLHYMRRMLCHWAGDSRPPPSTWKYNLPTTIPVRRRAGRCRVGPHIKTYLRFSNNDSMDRLDWALLTSANLSKQAWGAEANQHGEVRICSYEIGVLVWPDLWRDEVTGAGGEGDVRTAGQGRSQMVEMVPTFKTDMPDGPIATLDNDGIDADTIITGQIKLKKGNEDGDGNADGYAGSASSLPATSTSPKVQVGLRMPYDLPLVPYSSEDMPWSATEPDMTPDWMGRVWQGFGS